MHWDKDTEKLCKKIEQLLVENEATIEQSVQFAEFFLHEAILNVLLENYEEGVGIGPKEISTFTGMYRGKGNGKSHDGMAKIFLSQLLELNKIEPKTEKNKLPGWILTKEEYEFRR